MYVYLTNLLFALLCMRKLKFSESPKLGTIYKQTNAGKHEINK